jgi:phosphoglucomutase
MAYRQKLEKWLSHPSMEAELKEELEKIAADEAELQSRFSRELTFGTGGIRGRMGAGIARLNIYMIRKVTAGLANYLQRDKSVVPSVVIAYDTRHNSRRFAREAAAVLTCRGIKTQLFEEPVPTPLLSFAVRELKASAGVVITASHNPPADNGYKVYGPDGGQITDAPAQAITEEINLIEDELAIQVADLEEMQKNGFFEPVGPEIVESYLQHLQELRLSPGWCPQGPLPVRVVYTPLHGTGAGIIPRALKNAGVTDLFLVAEQMIMDPRCPTVQYPNPEEWEVFDLALTLGKKEKADLLLATDLDGDRLGAVVRSDSGEYVPLTGNQLGCLMLDYLLFLKKERGDLGRGEMMIQTVVTTAMGKAIAASYGLEVLETLTGFKYIGELIKERVDTGRNRFLFGFEESYGYLIGSFVRDKDGVQAAQVAAEMVAYYNHRGMNILQALEQLYQVHGYFREELVNLTLNEEQPGRLEQVMKYLRGNSFNRLGERKVVRIDDYLEQTGTDMLTGKHLPIKLPASNSIKFNLEGGAWFCVRPSGTEPKLKIYLGVREKSLEGAIAGLGILKEKVLAVLGEDR